MRKQVLNLVLTSLIAIVPSAHGEEVSNAVCSIDAVAAIPQVLVGTGFNSIEEACTYLDTHLEGEGADEGFAAMQNGSAAGSAFGIGVWKCILEWCGYGAKKGDDAPSPRIPKPNPPSKPQVPKQGPKLPELIDELEKKRKNAKESPGLDRIDEDDLPPDYEFEVSPLDPSAKPNFPPPRKPKIDSPTKPNDTSKDEVIGTADLEEFKRRYPEKGQF